MRMIVSLKAKKFHLCEGKEHSYYLTKHSLVLGHVFHMLQVFVAQLRMSIISRHLTLYWDILVCPAYIPSTLCMSKDPSSSYRIGYHSSAIIESELSVFLLDCKLCNVFIWYFGNVLGVI